MSYIEWSDKYSVGNDMVDTQHQKLMDIINRYHDALEEKRPRAELVKIFDEVADYAIYHFRDEEALMERIQFPKMARHKVIHKQLIEQIGKLRAELVSGVAEIEQQIRFFLKNWLTAHIVGIDTQYTPFLAH
ncbi:MAG: bacteriohemerythrin [Nevskia sp.]|jgi:hemerythrin-like metal-binding protein|nr:bacteriohemerythrin [Nevskia sp.]